MNWRILLQNKDLEVVNFFLKNNDQIEETKKKTSVWYWYGKF
jgi:hypothetical protein